MSGISLYKQSDFTVVRIQKTARAPIDLGHLAGARAHKLIIIVEPNVHLHVKDTFEHAGSYARTYFVHEDASLTCHLAFADIEQLQLNLDLQLQGAGAHARVRGLYLLSDTQQFTITTTQNHNAPRTQSDLLIKGLLSGQAQAQYRGTIRVSTHAPQANALQYNKNMLLSTESRAISIPSLEVLTNDVRCMHGSAVGQLHAEQLYYLQSRGLSKKEAARILLAGFCADVHDVMDQGALMERVDYLLKEKQ